MVHENLLDRIDDIPSSQITDFAVDEYKTRLVQNARLSVSFF